MIVGKEIALQAKQRNICEPWFEQMLEHNDIKPLCEMYFKGSDWAMQNDFPAIATLRKFRGKSEQYGLFTDFKGSAGMVDTKSPQHAAFFGASDAELLCDRFTVCDVIVRHQSKVRILATQRSFVVVTLLDSAFVEVQAEENSRVIIYQYGSFSNFRVSGDVEIREASWQK